MPNKHQTKSIMHVQSYKRTLYFDYLDFNLYKRDNRCDVTRYQNDVDKKHKQRTENRIKYIHQLKLVET